MSLDVESFPESSRTTFPLVWILDGPAIRNATRGDSRESISGDSRKSANRFARIGPSNVWIAGTNSLLTFSSLN